MDSSLNEVNNVSLSSSTAAAALPPLLPLDSPGSSVSTDMEEEFNELVYKYNKNIFSNFSSNSNSNCDNSNSNVNISKTCEVNKPQEELQLDNKDFFRNLLNKNDDDEFIFFKNETNHQMDLMDVRTNEYEKIVDETSNVAINISISSINNNNNNLTKLEEDDTNIRSNNFDGQNLTQDSNKELQQPCSSTSSSAKSSSPLAMRNSTHENQYQHLNLSNDNNLNDEEELININHHYKHLNSLTLVSADLQNSVSLQTENSIKTNEIEEKKFSQMKHANRVETNLNQSSFESHHSTSSSTCSPSSSSAQSNLSSRNQSTNNNQFDSINDANPRHSPVPVSPPSNIELYENQNDSSLLAITTNEGIVTYAPHANSKITNRNHSNTNKTSNLLNRQAEQFDINNNLSINHQVRQQTQKQTNNVKIANCLDKWYRELKGQVLSEFEKSRLLILQDQQKKLIEEKEKQTIEIGKLKRELDLVRESLKLYERNTLKKDAEIENLTRAFEKQREKNDLQKVMMEWKVKRIENAKEAFSNKLADNYYERRLKMKAFIQWHSFLINKHKLKIEKACKKKAEEVCFELAKKYETKIRKLEEELGQSRSDIEKYKLEMNKHEESVKKALMRGVCALNMEAMSIFNDSNEPKVDRQPHVDHLAFHRAKNATDEKSQMADKELSRKVKTYCEASLKRESNLIAQHERNSSPQKVTAALASLSNRESSRSRFINNSNQTVFYSGGINITKQHQQQQQSNEDNTNKVYEELVQHDVPVLTNKNPKKIVKSKIGSLPTSTNITNQDKFQAANSRGSSATSLPPYRSIIIEKHTSIVGQNTAQRSSDAYSSLNSAKYNLTRVNQTAPSSNQSTSVLSSLISTN